MRIDPRFISPASASLAAGRARPASERFTLAQDGEAERPSAARAAAPLATLDAILALQGEEDAGERRRRSAGRGKRVLDALDDLKAALLAGRIAPDRLRQIVAGLPDLRAESGDPGLDQVLAEIDLRARVEMAKLGVTA